jgi:hypothetical protein
MKDNVIIHAILSIGDRQGCTYAQLREMNLVTQQDFNENMPSLLKSGDVLRKMDRYNVPKSTWMEHDEIMKPRVTRFLVGRK